MTICKICGEKAVAQGLCRKHYDKKFRMARYRKNRDKAIEYSKKQSQNRKEILARKISPNLICSECSSPLELKEKRKIFIVDNNKKVICEKCWHKKREITTFSRRYKKCRTCGTTENHAALGFCGKCYSKYLRNNRK